MRLKTVLLVGICMLAVLSMTANADMRPRRGKNYLSPDKLGSMTTEDIEEPSVVEEVSFLDRITGDARLKPWLTWWKACAPSFRIEEMVDAGVMALGSESVAANDEYTKGPNREFLVRRGGLTLNPVWGRMHYVKNGNIWEAQMLNPYCGVMIYDGSKERKIIHCGELDGVFGGFWVDGKRAVVTAYRKISPEMNAECQAKEVGQCIAPILWLVDLKGDSVWEYRGPVVTLDTCDPNDFLMQLYPEFFGVHKN